MVPALARLRDLFAGLRGSGAERDAAGNRTLHYDDYCVLVLLALFSPARRHYAFLLYAERRLGRGLPTRRELSSGRSSRDSGEKSALRGGLTAGCRCLMDRWFAQLRWFHDVHAAESNYGCRVRDNSV